MVQKKIFNKNQLIDNLKIDSQVGSVVTFCGYVRDFSPQINKHLNKYLFIEHYDGMTQRYLKKIEGNVLKKWKIKKIIIVHRIGEISINDPIVFVGVSTEHRDDAFDACRYIIDYLKISAPFWKKEVSGDCSEWVKQKESDLLKVK